MRLTIPLMRNFKDVGELTKRFSNFPDSYIKRTMEQVYYETPKARNYLPRKHERRNFKFSTHRPWTHGFLMENLPKSRSKKVFLEPIGTWSYFRGDRVQILIGKDKGKQGFVKQVIQERNWVIVEGLNCTFKTMKADENDKSGVIYKHELPLLVTNQVTLVDPTDFQPTSFEWRYLEDGTQVRVSLRTGRVIPIPASAEETIDYKTKKTYRERPKDTSAEHASAITFTPKLRTFEMDIMEELGIVEDRIPKKSYWY